MFVLLVAGDLYGRKHNMEIGFPGYPSFDDLISHCESAYNGESRRLKPEKSNKVQKFIVDTIKVFEDSLNRWVDIEDKKGELQEWQQLYLYQPEGCQDDTQALLPPPIPIRSPIEEGNAKEPLLFLFQDLDFQGNGYVNREEMQRIFNVLCLFEYSEQQVDHWFFSQDQTYENQLLSVVDFSTFANTHPEVMELLLLRSDLYWLSVRRKPAIVDAAYHLDRETQSVIERYLERYHMTHRCERENSPDKKQKVPVCKDRERFVQRYR